MINRGMNFNFYIIGTPEGRYSQYPEDYTAPTLAGLQENMIGARLVIYRDMDLMHYVYTERLNKNNFIGFCLIFNKARITKPRELIKLFRFIIEKRLVESGNIIKYTEDGDLKFNVKSLNKCIDEYDRLNGYINSELENNLYKYGIGPLTTIYNGVKSTYETDNNASDGQIVSLTDSHNKVVVNEDNGIEHGYIPQIIALLRDECRKRSAEIEGLKERNIQLHRQKKQYRYVLVLMLMILGCGAGLFFLNDNLKNTKANLEQANQTISNRDNIIVSLNNKVSSLKSSLSSEKEMREKAENDFVSFKSLLNGIQPFIVKKTSFAFDTGWLSFDYYGLREETIDLQVKAFSGDESYSNSKSMDVKKGNNSFSIYLSDNLNRSTWYSFELLVDKKIVGGDRH